MNSKFMGFGIPSSNVQYYSKDILPSASWANADSIDLLVDAMLAKIKELETKITLLETHD